MKILATMPGRFGDILWAMPTLRCLAEASGEPVDLLVGEEFDSLCALLRQQPYIDEARAIEGWTMDEKRPRMWPRDYDQVIHLAYPEWPTAPLHLYTWQTALMQFQGTLPPLDLDTPWITVPEAPQHLLDARPYITACWTEEWIELKMGVTVSVAQPGTHYFFVTHVGGRHQEFGRLHMIPNITLVQRLGWIELAQLIQHAQCYLGCLSAPWVLANGLGKQTVI